MSVDRRTGKPIAVAVIKAEQEQTNQARLTGTVVTEARAVKNKVVSYWS